jgi:hypothetical protein
VKGESFDALRSGSRRRRTMIIANWKGDRKMTGGLSREDMGSKGASSRRGEASRAENKRSGKGAFLGGFEPWWLKQVTGDEGRRLTMVSKAAEAVADCALAAPYYEYAAKRATALDNVVKGPLGGEEAPKGGVDAAVETGRVYRRAGRPTLDWHGVAGTVTIPSSDLGGEVDTCSGLCRKPPRSRCVACAPPRAAGRR